MKIAGFFLAAFSTFFLTVPAFAASSDCSGIVKDFPGTYTLVKRTLADGTVLKGPEAQGTIVFTPGGHSSVTISVNNPHDNTYDMVALQTQYSVSNTEFTNRIIAMATQFGKSNSPVQYIFDQSKLHSPVVCKNGVLDLSHPADYPLSDLTITKEGKLLAYHSDANLKGAVDEWIKIK